MGVGGADHRLADLALEGEALVGLVQADGLEIADLAVQAGQLSILVQFELQHLAVLELAELLGLLAARQHVVHDVGRQADLVEQGRKRITAADHHFTVAWRLLFWFGGRGRRRFSLGGLGLGAVDLGEWRVAALSGLYEGGAAGFVLELFCRALELQAEGGFLGFHFAGREDQQGQAEEGGNAAGGQQMAFRIKRGRFRRFVGHRLGDFEKGEMEKMNDMMKMK